MFFKEAHHVSLARPVRVVVEHTALGIKRLAALKVYWNHRARRTLHWSMGTGLAPLLWGRVAIVSWLSRMHRADCFELKPERVQIGKEVRKNNSTAAVLQLICPFLLQGTCDA